MEILNPREILEAMDQILESLEQNDECPTTTLELAYLLREDLTDTLSQLLDDE